MLGHDVKKMIGLTVLSMAVSGCASVGNGLATGAGAVPAGGSAFEGEWVISDYQERGVTTHKHDGKVVTIRKSGNLYTIDAPDWFFLETKFHLSGRTLVGQNVQDYDGLKDIWRDTPESVMPDSVLRQAAASKSVVYRGTMTMLRDGRIAVERDNLEIMFMASTGRFDSVRRHPGWIQFTLSRR